MPQKIHDLYGSLYNIDMYDIVGLQVIVARPREDCMAMHGCHAVLQLLIFVIQSTAFYILWSFNVIHGR